MDNIQRWETLKAIMASMTEQNWGRAEATLAQSAAHLNPPGSVHPCESAVQAIQSRNYGEAIQIIDILIEGVRDHIMFRGLIGD